MIDLKLVAYSKLGTSFPRFRTPRVRVLTLIDLKLVAYS